jgi:hypothetical protein
MSINGVTTGKSIAQRFAGSFFLSGSQRNSFLPTATVRLTANRPAHGKKKFAVSLLWPTANAICLEPFF